MESNVPMLRISEKVRIISELTSLPLRLYYFSSNNKGHTRYKIFAAFPREKIIEKLGVPAKITQSARFAFSTSVTDAYLFEHKTDLCVCYGIPFHHFISENEKSPNNEKILLVIGPVFFSSKYDTENLSDSDFFHNINESEWKELIKVIPIKNLDYIYTAIQALFDMLFGVHVDVPKLLGDDKTANINFYRDLYEVIYNRREQSLFNSPFAREQKIWNIIRSGDISKTKDAIRMLETNKGGVVATNPLRHSKNMFICVTTLATRYAIWGGLPDDIAYAMSDTFIQRVERMNSLAEIIELRRKMVGDFIMAVNTNKHKKLSKYSKEVEKCISYIERNLHSKIQLEKLAEETDLSVQQVSRKFKAETGENVVEFYNKQRVLYAREMLLFTDRTLLDISNTFSFSSQSYFCAVFKKYTGQSPLDYRRHKFTPDLFQPLEA